MKQYDLFGGLPPHVKTSDSSREAAIQIKESSSSLRMRILNLIMKSGSMTCDEVEVKTGLRHQTASARIRELVLKGFIEDSSERRKTRSGRNAVIYKIRGD